MEQVRPEIIEYEESKPMDINIAKIQNKIQASIKPKV